MYESQIDHQKALIKNLKADNRRLTLTNQQLGKRVSRLEEQLLNLNQDPEADTKVKQKKSSLTPIKRKRNDANL